MGYESDRVRDHRQALSEVHPQAQGTQIPWACGLFHAPTDTITEEQRQRLLEIADRCPVHRTLHSEVKVRSVLLPPTEPT